MTLEELTALITHPDRLDRNTLSALAQLVEAYPYAHAIVLLYLLNLSTLGDLRFDAELERWAPFLPSREKLYLLVQMHLPLEELAPRVGEIPGDSFSLIDQYLHLLEQREGPQGNELSYESDLSDRTIGQGGDYFSPQEYDAFEAQRDSTSLLLSTQLETDSETPLVLDDVPSSYTATLPTSSPDVPPSTMDDLLPSDTLLTETLASIYITQGHYERARAIIQGLMLKFPEKNSYFAIQLDFLQRLIDNTSAE